MLGSKDYGAPELEIDGPWADFRAARGVFPRARHAPMFVARAITDRRGGPKRFDTRFFAIDREAIAHDGPRGGRRGLRARRAHVGLDRRARALDLPTITAVVLDELTARIEAGFSPMLPVPYYHMVRGAFVRELV